MVPAMDGEREYTRAELAGLLEWWVEAGVDVAVAEQPRNWLSARPRPAAPENVAEPSHDTLAELQDWLASSVQLPLATATAKRILPHGPENAAVMLLSDAPSLEDLASGQPIGGEAWTLAAKMLAAIGIAADEAYSASLSCFHTPGARMTDADRAACAQLARRHIALVKPRRLLLLGDGPCKALLGQPLPGARGHAHKVDGVRTVATFHPRFLMERPGNKAQAWADLLLLMEDDI